MNSYIIVAGLRDLIRPVRIFAWLMAAFFMMGVAVVWRTLSKEMSPLEAYGQLADVFIFRLTALAATVMSMGVVAQEVDQRTIVYLLTRSQRRWSLLLGRWIAAVIASTAAGWLTVFGASFALMQFGALTSGVVWRDLGLVFVGAAAYCSIFTLFSLVMNRALIASLLFAFGWETFAQNLEGMKRLSLLGYLNSLTNHPDLIKNGLINFMAGDLGMATKPPAWVSLGVLFGVTAAVICLCMWIFEHYEYTPREDAE